MHSFAAKIKSYFGAVNLREGKEWKVLLRFSLPIVLSYLLQQIYTVSDAVICGQTLSADEVAGVNDVFPLTFIFLQFAFGCTAGFSVITSTRVGNSDAAGVRRSFASQIVLSAIITAVLTALSIATLPAMLGVINLSPANGEVYRAAYEYCFVIFCGIFTQMFYNFVCSVLRSIGDSATPLLFLFISTVLNVALDLLFIMAFGWGVIGAAAATVLAQGLSTVACFIYTFAKYPELRLHKEDFRRVKGEYFAHLRQGLPLGLQFSVLAVGIIVMQGTLVAFDVTASGQMVAGNPAQNGFGAATKLNNFMMSPLNALGTAMVSFNAQNYGAGQYDRIKRGMKQSLVMMLVLFVALAGTGLLLTVDNAYLKLFLSADKITAESVRFGNHYLFVDFGLYFALGALFVMRGGVQGIGKSSFVLLAGAAELTARILVCIFLPVLANGAPITSEASELAYLMLCAADPAAWFAAVAALAYPTIRYMLRGKYPSPSATFAKKLFYRPRRMETAAATATEELPEVKKRA